MKNASSSAPINSSYFSMSGGCSTSHRYKKQQPAFGKSWLHMWNVTSIGFDHSTADSCVCHPKLVIPVAVDIMGIEALWPPARMMLAESYMWFLLKFIWVLWFWRHFYQSENAMQIYDKITWSFSRIHMMTPSNGNIFCVTGPLWVETTGHQWIP